MDRSTQDKYKQIKKSMRSPLLEPKSYKNGLSKLSVTHKKNSKSVYFPSPTKKRQDYSEPRNIENMLLGFGKNDLFETKIAQEDELSEDTISRLDTGSLDSPEIDSGSTIRMDKSSPDISSPSLGMSTPTETLLNGFRIEPRKPALNGGLSLSLKAKSKINTKPMLKDFKPPVMLNMFKATSVAFKPRATVYTPLLKAKNAYENSIGEELNKEVEQVKHEMAMLPNNNSSSMTPTYGMNQMTQQKSSAKKNLYVNETISELSESDYSPSIVAVQNHTSEKRVNKQGNVKISIKTGNMSNGCNINVSNCCKDCDHSAVSVSATPMLKLTSKNTKVNSLEEFLKVFDCKVVSETDKMIKITQAQTGETFEAFKGIFTKYCDDPIRQLNLKQILKDKSHSIGLNKSMKMASLQKFARNDSTAEDLYRLISITNTDSLGLNSEMRIKQTSDTTFENMEAMSLDDDFSEDEKERNMNKNETGSTKAMENYSETTVARFEMTEQRKGRHVSMNNKESDQIIDRLSFDRTEARNVLSKIHSVDQPHQKMYDPTREIEQLRDELRVSNSEIQRLMLTKQVSSTNNCTSSYHLAFMYASPLVRKVNKNLEMIMQLDYHKEIEGIEKQLKKAKHEIKYKVDVATISKFRSVIADAPFALHFTGHGIKNDRKSLGPAHHLYENKGNILLLEDENGMADYLFENDLKKLVQISKANRDFSHNYEVVFVSSCHSEFAGNIFLSSGANHVICIKKSETITDKASLRFSSVFYDTIFIKKYCVCKAFEIAKEDIKSFYTRSEANKYMLLTNDSVDEDGNKLPHKCFPIAHFNAGSLQKMGETPLFKVIPSNVQNFRGRQKETCEVLTILNENRLVNILGPPGIGKTALSRAICNHLYDRQRFEDGIIYLSLRGCESALMFLTRLILAIDNELRSDEPRSPKYKTMCIDKTPSPLQITTNEGQKQTKMMNYIVQTLRNKEVLLVLDGCEQPLQDDAETFVQFIDYFLVECSKIKMLLTSRRYINKLDNHQEIPYHLHPLSSQATMRLLLDNLQRKIDSAEMQELLNYEIPPTHPMNEYFPLMDPEKMTMSNHPFTILLGGHPQAILLAASTLENQTLTQLFVQLLDSNIIDALDGQQEKHSYASLRMSLDISIKNIQTQNPEALDLFKLIGLLPGGINQKDIAKLWGNNKWMSLKNHLMRASMLVHRQAEDNLSMLPFMSTRASELLEQDQASKVKFHMNICQMYKDYCVTFLASMNSGNFDLNEFIQNEANIWACIYRGINRKKDNDEYDVEQDTKIKMTRSLTVNTRNNGMKRDDSMGSARKRGPIKTPLINPIYFPIAEAENDYSISEGSEDDEHTVMEDQIISIGSETSTESDPTSDSDEPKLLTKKKMDIIFKEQSTRTMARTKTLNSFSELSTISITNQSNFKSRKSVVPNNFKIEELLVMHYIAIVIRLCKLSDGCKAINEYSKKNVLSHKAQAHLHQFQGVLELMYENRDLQKICEHFEEAIKFYRRCNSILGVSICQLAILRAKYEQYAADESKAWEMDKLCHKVEQLKKNFESINSDLGSQRAEELIKSIKSASEGNENVAIKSFLRFKTLKKSYIATVKAKDNKIGDAILNNEDIKLFTSIIEIDIKIKKRPQSALKTKGSHYANSKSFSLNKACSSDAFPHNKLSSPIKVQRVPSNFSKLRAVASKQAAYQSRRDMPLLALSSLQ